MTVYRLTLQTLVPLHIGDGHELHQDFDFAVHQNRTYRLDEDAILLAKGDRLRPDRQGHYPPPGKLLDEADFQRAAFFRYVLNGSPRSQQTDAILRTFLKDVYDRPYIPGSSLKGALRTALAWTGWPEVKPRLERSAIGRHRAWAGQPLERKLFGPDPNHDLLRALHVSDLFAAKAAKPAQGLMLVNAQVLTLRSHGSPIELEALAGDLTFQGSLTVEDALFAPWAEKELGFQNRRHWLDGKEMMARVQAHSQARIHKLQSWFARADGGEVVARFYRQLAAANPGPNRALVQLGWGTGWDGKTFWSHLQSDAQLFEQLVSEFRLSKTGRSAAPRRPGDPFPKSRRVAMIVKDRVPRAAAPFGWALLELEKG